MTDFEGGLSWFGAYFWPLDFKKVKRLFYLVVI